MKKDRLYALTLYLLNHGKTSNAISYHKPRAESSFKSFQPLVYIE